MLVIAIVYRLNTFPFIHINIFHAILNVLALTPLLERFEHEHGTLTSVALFFGREYKAPLMRQDGTGIHSGDTWTNLIGNSSDHATGVALHTGRNYFGLEHGSHGSQVGFVFEHSWTIRFTYSQPRIAYGYSCCLGSRPFGPIGPTRT